MSMKDANWMNSIRSPSVTMQTLSDKLHEVEGNQLDIFFSPDTPIFYLPSVNSFHLHQKYLKDCRLLFE